MHPSRFLLLLLFLCSCHRPNPVYTSGIGHIRRVVILGNSIVKCPPVPDIGWMNDWGMAASAREKDFVHLLIKDIQAKDPRVAVSYRNMAAFERGYRTFDLSQLDTLRGADLYIFRLAENVPDTATGYIFYYDSLIRFLNTRNGINVIVDGFWKNPVNPRLRDYADRQDYPFIRNSDLSGDKSLEAGKQYSNYGVSVHPSDKGMQAIEKRIWDYLHVYF